MNKQGTNRNTVHLQNQTIGRWAFEQSSYASSIWDAPFKKSKPFQDLKAVVMQVFFFFF